MKDFPFLKLTKGVFPNDKELQKKVNRIGRIVFILGENDPNETTDFAAEAERIRRGLSILPRGTLRKLGELLAKNGY